MKRLTQSKTAGGERMAIDVDPENGIVGIFISDNDSYLYNTGHWLLIDAPSIPSFLAMVDSCRDELEALNDGDSHETT